MTKSGRPRKHDHKADVIRQMITYSTADEAIDLLKQTDVNVLDGEARTPLFYAIIEDRLDIFVWLLAHGADINHQDRNGWSALDFAIQGKRIEIAKLLLEQEASIDLKDPYGNTPLWRATFDAKGDYELVKILISHGADPHLKNNSGRSPLDFASQIKDDELIKILKKD
jgi:ankyrin repeat protein